MLCRNNSPLLTEKENIKHITIKTIHNRFLCDLCFKSTASVFLLILAIHDKS